MADERSPDVTLLLAGLRQGDGCAEPYIRVPKVRLLWVRSLATVAELVEAPREFRRAYDERWLIGRQGHRTPSQVRRDHPSSKSAAA